MSERPEYAPDFRISHETEPGETLLAGFSAFGLAGLTAVDYLVDHLELEERGHITADGLPSITPFEGGRPRHHTRLFSADEVDVTVLVNELFVPATVGGTFSDAILDWTERSSAEEVAILAGIPIQHGPDDHQTYYIATEDYYQSRLQGVNVPPMSRGFLDGTNAAIVERGLDSSLGVGVYVTPVHARTPDVEATIRLVETVERVYDLGVDAGPLESFAQEVEQYYADLSERLQEQEAEFPEDRMYM